MIASFSALGVDLPSIALIVLHSFVKSVLWSKSPQTVSTFVLCTFVRYSGDLIVHPLQGGRGSLWIRGHLMLSSFSNISVGTAYVLSRYRIFGSWSEAVFCSACLLTLYGICPSFHFSC